MNPDATRSVTLSSLNSATRGLKGQGVAEGSSGVSVRQWANQVRKDHGPDVKFRNRQEGGGAVDSVIAKNSQGETVGVYNRKTGYPTVYEPKQGVAEGKDDKIAQLKKDHDTAVHWSKNETSPQKREAARQKAEKIKRHLDTQYKQGVAEEKTRLDPSCWKGYKKQGTKMKGDTRVNNCVPKESAIMKGLVDENRQGDK
jgi:hypothetical protein